MRSLVAVLIAGAVLVMLLVAFGTGGTPEDDALADSITQWVKKTGAQGTSR